MVAEFCGSGHGDPEPNYARHLVERPQMLPYDSESVDRSQVSGHASRFHVEFSADAADEFCFAADSWKHSCEKKQVARLHCLRVGAERFRRRGKLDAKFF